MLFSLWLCCASHASSFRSFLGQHFLKRYTKALYKVAEPPEILAEAPLARISLAAARQIEIIRNLLGTPNMACHQSSKTSAVTSLRVSARKGIAVAAYEGAEILSRALSILAGVVLAGVIAALFV